MDAAGANLDTADACVLVHRHGVGKIVDVRLFEPNAVHIHDAVGAAAEICIHTAASRRRTAMGARANKMRDVKWRRCRARTAPG